MDIESAQIFTTSCNRRCRSEAQPYVRSRHAQSKRSEAEIVREARRCLYCAKPGCVPGCPTQLDAKRMIHAAGEANFYEAGRVALTSNPLALSCGALCSAETCCKSLCNLAKTTAGPIAINEIQQFSLERFFEYRLKPTVTAPKIEKRVAIIGAGPAGLAAAAFLARLNFAAVDVYEKSARAGGLVAQQVPYFRLPKDAIEHEAELIAGYPNVHFHYNECVDKERLGKLAKEYDAVFVGVGRGGKAIEFEGTVTAAEFLTDINREFKFAEPGFKSKYGNLNGKRVVIMGSGDIAVDCAEAAKRLGAEYTALLMREDIRTATCLKKSLLGVVDEDIEIIPSLLPQRVATNDKGELIGVVCKDLLFEANGERTVPADIVICAFGVRRDPADVAPGTTVEAANEGKVAGYENVFCGGDYAGGNTIVEAVNDAKNAVVRITELLTGKKKEEIVIPRFTTVVDDVDISITVDGVLYKNPYGISSAPISGDYEHIKRCFDCGFGFAVTKTFQLDKDIQKNNHIRIVKVYDGPDTTSYNNIVMISEHPTQYWIDSIVRLKREYPDKIVIASIMCMDNEKDWTELAKRAEASGADALELNFSCPNECHGNDGKETSCTGGFKSSNAMAMAIGIDPVAVKRCTGYVTKAVKIPVYPKLTPNVANIEDLAKAAMEAGAAGVSLINTVFGISEVTLSGHPFPQVGKGRNTISGGLSGDLVRPIAIRQIAQVLRHNPNVKGHLLGIGGVRSANTAMQLIYTGASVIQMCSVCQKYSYEVVEEIISGTKFILYCWSRPDLRAYLNSQGVERFLPYGSDPEFWKLSAEQDRAVPRLDDVRGKALEHIGERVILEGPEKWRVRSQIDPDLCIGCGSCQLTCRDNATDAINLSEDGRVFVVDGEKCFGCALCSSVCPVSAIKYVPLPGLDELPPEEASKIPIGF